MGSVCLPRLPCPSWSGLLVPSWSIVSSDRDFWERTPDNQGQYSQYTRIHAQIWNQDTRLHREKSIFSQRLEELAKDEVDQANEVLVRLVSR